MVAQIFRVGEAHVPTPAFPEEGGLPAHNQPTQLSAHGTEGVILRPFDAIANPKTLWRTKIEWRRAADCLTMNRQTPRRMNYASETELRRKSLHRPVLISQQGQPMSPSDAGLAMAVQIQASLFRKTRPMKYAVRTVPAGARVQEPQCKEKPCDSKTSFKD